MSSRSRREKEAVYRVYLKNQSVNIVVVALPLALTVYVLWSKWETISSLVALILILLAIALAIILLLMIRITRLLIRDGVDGIRPDDIEWYRAQLKRK